MMQKLALRTINDNITTAPTGATAWFVLPGVRWSFRSDAVRDEVVVDTAQRFAALTGRRIHIRVTSRPWSAQGWRQSMTGTAIAPLPAWDAHLDSEADHLETLALADKVVYLGVRLDRPLAGMAKLFGTQQEHNKLLGQVAEISRYVASSGLDARPATQAEVEWLIRRSVALGCPSPPASHAIGGAWLESDIAEFADTATWSVEPFAQYMKVVADIGGEQVTRFVSVLTVGRMGELDSNRPWLAKTDRLNFPVEIAVTADILSGRVVVKGVQSAMLRIKSQTSHYAEHDQPPPYALDRAQKQAMTIQDEIERGMNGLSTRADVWIRLAVSGVSESEVLDRALRVQELYAPAVTVVHTSEQYALAREFIPCEPQATPSYRRRMPVTTLAGANPAVTQQVGHELGVYLGYTSQGSARKPVLWDLHRSMEVRERSGLTLVAGGLGAGKSGFAGLVIYKAALAGIHTVVLDPSGPLSRLCELPELRATSRHIDLLSAQPGILSPYRVIPDPVRGHHPTQEAYLHAVSMAQASRQTLCADVLRMFLPAEISEDILTYKALAAATDAVPGFPQNSAREVIGQLVKAGGHAREVGNMLERVSQIPAAQLVFPSGYSLDADGTTDDAALTVISMRNLVLPPENAERKDWTDAERMAVPLMHLAAWLTQRSVHQRDMSERKLIVTDETHALARVASGRALLTTAARDSRKHNVRVIFASQGINDILGANVGNLVDSVFVGRTEDRDAQTAALKVLGVPTGVGYEEALGTLSKQARGAAHRSGSREFVYSDGEFGVERITVDQSSLPAHVVAALDTTPHAMVKPQPVRLAS